MGRNKKEQQHLKLLQGQNSSLHMQSSRPAACSAFLHMHNAKSHQQQTSTREKAGCSNTKSTAQLGIIYPLLLIFNLHVSSLVVKPF